ncbi:MAG: hypothetical protein ACP5P7_07320 [Sulfurihydrogenibium sp.]
MELNLERLEGKKEELISTYSKFIEGYISDYYDKVGAVERLEKIISDYRSTLKTTDTKKISLNGVHYCRAVLKFHCRDFEDNLNDFSVILRVGLSVFYNNPDYHLVYSGNTIKVLFSVSSSSEYLYYNFEDIVKFTIEVLEGFLMDISIPF